MMKDLKVMAMKRYFRSCQNFDAIVKNDASLRDTCFHDFFVAAKVVFDQTFTERDIRWAAKVFAMQRISATYRAKAFSFAWREFLTSFPDHSSHQGIVYEQVLGSVPGLRKQFLEAGSRRLKQLESEYLKENSK